jgi:Bacterial SH3 domain
LGVYPDRDFRLLGQTRVQVEPLHFVRKSFWGVVVEFKGASLVGKFNPLQVLRSPIVFGAWMTTAITVLGVGYAVLTPKPSQSQVPQEKRSIPELAKLGYCQTIATDPNPPLNVRSSPVSAPDNIIGNLKNGAELTVINENKGWLQISAPVRGWVYEPLTVTTCNPDRKTSQSANPYIPVAFESGSQAVKFVAEPSLTSPAVMPGDTLVMAAHEKFHNGDLMGAMANLRQVPLEDLSHEEASSLLKTMPTQWASASNLYHQAETALKNDRPKAVLELVSKVPDIRYWRSKMAPLVKLAIAHRSTQSAQ